MAFYSLYILTTSGMIYNGSGTYGEHNATGVSSWNSSSRLRAYLKNINPFFAFFLLFFLKLWLEILFVILRYSLGDYKKENVILGIQILI